VSQHSTLLNGITSAKSIKTEWKHTIGKECPPAMHT
jgi:hypothetical protein